MCTPSRGRARPPPGIGPRRPKAPEHTAGDAADAQAGDIIQPVRFVGGDRARRAQPAADGRTDALPEIARGEPRGIPRNEGVITAHDLDVAAQVVTEAARVVLCTRRQPALEGRHEVAPVRADLLAT